MNRFISFALIAFIAIFSAESTASAQILKNILKKTADTVTEQAVSPAYSQGQTAGTALKTLYAQYKSDGKKLDMSNISNILSITSLAGSIQELKSSDSAYKKEYAKGLIKGSMNLVTEPQSTSVISGLTSLAKIDLSSITDNPDLKQAASQALQSKASDILADISVSPKMTETKEKATDVAAKAASTIENASEIASSVTSILNLFK